jgi:ornithine decarboxylase
LLDHYAAPINLAVDKYFGDSVSVISEPGRYFVESALTLAAQVILKRETSDGMMHYYLNEGIYMSFLISYIYEDNLKFEIIRKTPKSTPTERMAIIWGSSCNSKDKIIDSRMIPDLEMDDWLIFRNMGAYTTSVSTNFNGFKIGKTFTC